MISSTQREAKKHKKKHLLKVDDVHVDKGG